MNRNYRVITINGIRGLIAVILIAFGLISGFVISPGWVCMQAWNHIFENSNTVQQMQLYQGILLWAIIAVCLYAINNRRAVIGFNTFQGLTPEQVKDIMRRARESELNVIQNIDMIKREQKDNFEQATETVKEEEKEEVRR